MIRVVRSLWSWFAVTTRDRSYESVKYWEEIENVGEKKQPPRYDRWY